MVANIAGNPINVIMSNDMPIGTPELIRHNEDDSYTVMLNAKYDHETLEKGFKHAIDHIHRNDWEKEDVQIIEAQAHGLPEAPAAPAPDPRPDTSTGANTAGMADQADRGRLRSGILRRTEIRIRSVTVQLRPR